MDYIKSDIIMLQGPPACGKSTWAKEYVKDYPETIIISRDNIRESTGTYWVEKRENLITSIEENMIRESLINNFQIIIDATNLNEKTINKWKNIALELHKTMLTKTFILPYDKALENDSKRGKIGEKMVGYKVIKRFYRQYFPELLNESQIQTYNNPYIDIDCNKQNAIIIDIDGTIAHMNGRSPYDYSKVNTDILDSALHYFLKQLPNDIHIIFVSGRMANNECLNKTYTWLNNFFTEYVLYMRRDKDFRSDDIVKEEIYHNFIEPKYNIIAVIDDRDKVVKMWRKLGLLTFQINEGNF